MVHDGGALAANLYSLIGHHGDVCDVGLGMVALVCMCLAL